jgi:murein DD-endopeptidase MepM/ murein hydrolase activator NlpD
MAFYYPIEVIQLRTKHLASSHSATYGLVRNNNTANHQGWDLFAPAGTRCYAIAAGHVEWIRSSGAYGQQLALSFNRDGSDGSSSDPLIAFYAHLRLGSVVVAPGTAVRAGQFVALTGTSGNASPDAPHLHFEIRTSSAQAVGGGLANRTDPGQILGYGLYNSMGVQIGGADAQRHMSVMRGVATPIIRR